MSNKLPPGLRPGRAAAPQGRFFAPVGGKLLPTDAPPSSPAGLGVQSETQETTLIYDYFTKPGETRLLYSAVGWRTVKLLLQNAGPVAIGTKPDLMPVLSGAGALLQTNVWFGGTGFIIAKGTRLYIAADAVNRVSVVIEPLFEGR